jgi:hypothetical protein
MLFVRKPSVACNIIIIQANYMFYNLYRLACLSRSAVSAHINSTTVGDWFIAEVGALGDPGVNAGAG